MFSVTATGSQPLAYQWKLNGTNLNGATNASVTVSNVQPTNAGNYSVLVGNTAGSTNSANALLTVNGGGGGSCTPPPSGIVGWWPGNNNASDIVNGNNGTLFGNTTFAAGEVSQAFSFDGNFDSVNLGNPTNLQLQNLTIEAWIKRGSTNVASLTPGGGAIMAYGGGGYSFVLEDNGKLGLGVVDGVNSSIGTPTVADTNYHHVAMTRNGTNVVFYVDGAGFPAPPFNQGFSFSTPVAIGGRGDNASNSFLGSIDELAVYNRALTGAEVLAIFNAGANGKCGVPPLITSQPTNVTVTAGNNASFSVTATGSLPLSYQWRLNGTNVSGATNSSVTISNAQPANAGNYSVVVANFVTNVTSSNALLTVIPASLCVAPPSGIVGWWPGNSNANDVINGNNGTLQGDATFVAGKVGQAFKFDGSGDQVNVGNPAVLQLQNLTIEAWIKRGSTNQASLTPGGGVVFGYGQDGYALAVLDDGSLVLTQVGDNNVTTSPKITDTNFHHLAVTHSGTNTVFYVDGVATTMPPYNPTFTFGTSAAIGARGDGAAGTFLGVIDEVSVYNRALSAAELQAIFGAGSDGKCLPLPLSIVQVVSATAVSNIVVVPVNLVANGFENALGFSLNFNPASLSFNSVSLGSGDPTAALAPNTNLLASGKLGVGVAMPANTTFSAGTQQVAKVSFSVLGVTSNTVTPVTFGDQPTLRQIVDVSAHVIGASYVNGTVTIPFIGYEGDVSPRSNGDGAVTIADWVQVGRFVAGLDIPATNANELQRADCAPRSTLGDGVLTVADWVQAGRYSVGADPLTPAGGPGGLSGLFAGASAGGSFGPSQRVISIPSGSAQAGQPVHVSVMLAAQGDESALGFSVNFNPAVLTFNGASVGSGAAGATLNVNSDQAYGGVLGLALSLPIANSFSSGDTELVKLDFTVTPSASGTTSLAFASQPVIQAVADVTAETLTANYVGGDLTITPLVVVGGPALRITQGTNGLLISWPASANGYILESTDDPASGNWTPIADGYITNATDISLEITPSATRQFYRLHHP
jgi:hypothetical protein